MNKPKHKQEYWPTDPSKYNLNLIPEKEENPWIVGAAVLMLSFTLAYLIAS